MGEGIAARRASVFSPLGPFSGLPENLVEPIKRQRDIALSNNGAEGHFNILI
jgi:hypothetical protein